MKIKLLIVSIFLFLVVTGCSANYSIDISNNSIKENLSIIEYDYNKANSKSINDKSFADYAKDYGINLNINTSYQGLYSLEKCNNNCNYYSKEYIEDENKIGFSLSNNYTFDDFSNSSIANELIAGFSSNYDGRYLIISGNLSNNYFDDYENLDEINIKIETNYKVVSTNLKKIKNGSYNWKAKSNDKYEKSLFIKIDTKQVVENKQEDKKYLIILIITTISLIIILICYSVYKKRNEYS